jgi:hypothetical protein
LKHTSKWDRPFFDDPHDSLCFLDFDLLVVRDDGSRSWPNSFNGLESCFPSLKKLRNNMAGLDASQKLRLKIEIYYLV